MPGRPHGDPADQIGSPANVEDEIYHKELPLQCCVYAALHGGVLEGIMIDLWLYSLDLCFSLNIHLRSTTGNIHIDVIRCVAVQYRIDHHHQDNGQIGGAVVGQDAGQGEEQVIEVVAT